MRLLSARSAWAAIFFGPLAALGLLAACNGILGNEPRILDQRGEGGAGADADDDAFNAGDGPNGDAACNATLASDPKNCGACGHDCLGGDCDAGACQPFTIAKGQLTPDYPIVSDHVAYWTSNDGGVFKCPVSGCADKPTQLIQIPGGNPLPSGLDVHNGNVYVIGYYSQSILSCSINGCATATTVVSGLDNPSRVSADTTNVYYLNANKGDLERCDLPTCTRHVRMAIGIPAWFLMSAGDSDIYWVQAPNADPTNATIYTAPKNRESDAGGDLVLANRNPQEIFVRGNILYMTENGNVLAVTIASGLPEVTLASNEASPAGIYADATYVYWANLGDGTIRRCPLAGCGGKPTTLASGQVLPRGPFVTDDAIYWTELNGNRVRGLAK